jgi:hypothetical protein
MLSIGCELNISLQNLTGCGLKSWTEALLDYSDGFDIAVAV